VQQQTVTRQESDRERLRRTVRATATAARSESDFLVLCPGARGQASDAVQHLGVGIPQPEGTIAVSGPPAPAVPTPAPRPRSKLLSLDRGTSAPSLNNDCFKPLRRGRLARRHGGAVQNTSEVPQASQLIALRVQSSLHGLQSEHR